MQLRYIVVLLAMMTAIAMADVYMHSPPGSNDRNQEESTNRNNDNRLFNSQNNAKGGYCRGGILRWYEKSYLPIEWTNQHGCGNDQTSCNIILQYMCGSTADDSTVQVRDGTTTTTIPNDINQVGTLDNSELQFGMHESYYYYQNCTFRERNKGLFTANQNPGNSARSTRQQPGTTQYGFECPEERDYYPYWAPSPWKDIAVFTGNTDDCHIYQGESQNVKSKWYCVMPDTTKLAPVGQSKCTEQGGVWTEQKAWGISAPECIRAEWNHVNHLGLSQSPGKYNSYNWSLPHQGMEPCISAGNCRCVLRLRYNISSAEIKGYGKSALDSGDNGQNSPIRTDPTVQVAGDNVTLNINENQYGRTFQDRSHTFSIIARTPELKNAKIWNLLVKGKRGNIVQVYPAMEYQFTPNQLHMKINEHVHFQWTGCDHNPAGNTGNGRDQLDRSNIVQIHSLNEGKPFNDTDYNGDNALFTNSDVRKRFATLDQKGCLSYADLYAKNNGNKDQVEQDPQNCAFLNAAPNTFDGGVHQMDRTGSFYFMSTRNNDFSNRDQKGAIHVDPLFRPWQIALIAVGCALFVGLAATGGAMVYAKQHPHSGANRFFSKVPGVKRVVA
ncbi:hypothetical protein SAMD00019534_070720 [Acytostelium subglobosum LB1]|uniref:hypothetical protein n=1 Tax=Acytostelium subglobosum LB1 TaxID=1410327 RepID=UPI0006449950|nr:hypothetical protein SAMD00019534_070720 [Acytostelium subglobosum LB1]GAM23897.1 hypothetical protein SAMD00019534_070720 [Acytostelium subglobosum LB1]|eukprot:XP_012752933.1 hypothetical protein SAMD00019534_070720 [Acytostelium subglobosum LB1]